VPDVPRRLELVEFRLTDRRARELAPLAQTAGKVEVGLMQPTVGLRRVVQLLQWASLCEAHLPIVNELIQRYRLAACDYVAYEVSPWDVPIWYLNHDGEGYLAVLVPYKSWDVKPVTVEPGENPGDPPPQSYRDADTIGDADTHGTRGYRRPARADGGGPGGGQLSRGHGLLGPARQRHRPLDHLGRGHGRP